MARNAGAVVAGLLVSFAIVFVAEMIGHRVYPLPAGTDLTNPDALSAVVGQMPAGAFAFVLGGWLIAVGAGAWIAMWIAKSATLRPGLMVGLIFLVATVFNFMTIPHPIWVVAGGVLGIPLVAYLVSSKARVPAA